MTPAPTDDPDRAAGGLSEKEWFLLALVALAVTMAALVVVIAVY